MSFTIALAVLAVSLGFASAAEAQAPAGAVGETQVMKWKDGKTAAFLLAYDDSAPSHLTNAIPELEKRHLVGTFYINAGNGPYQAHAAEWEKVVKSPAVVLGNHTFKHAGATSPEQLDSELSKANEVIYKLNGDRKPPYLLSFARPGGVPWTVEAELYKAKLVEYHLVARPPFQGPPLSHKTLEDGFKIVDAAIAKGEVGHLDFHGVGGDWHVVPMDYYIPMLDRLQTESANGRLWVTDHITCHKYEAERKTAKATAAAEDKLIRVKLSADTDATLYDEPLTLQTHVPADWKACTVTQGKVRADAKVSDGVVQYEALPGAGQIVIEPRM